MEKIDIKKDFKKFKEGLGISTAVLVLVVGGGAFFGGIKYQENAGLKAEKSQYTNPFSGRNQFENMRNGNTKNNTTTQTGVGEKRMGNGQLTGEITSVDSSSITVKSNDGSSKIILISDKTTISKASTGQISDLKVGEKVAVFGTPNTDGSVIGSSVQLNPVTPNMPSGTPSGTPQK